MNRLSFSAEEPFPSRNVISSDNLLLLPQAQGYLRIKKLIITTKSKREKKKEKEKKTHHWQKLSAH